MTRKEQSAKHLARLKKIETFILDLDGTVYLSNTLIQGAREFIDFQRSDGRRFVFITNNSSRTEAEYADKLGLLGIKCRPEDIYTSLDATLAWMKGRQGHKVLALGTPSLVEKVRETGYEITSDAPDWVLLGFDTTLDYEKIRTAARAILAGARFVATHPDLTCPTADGPIPDTGSFIRMFEAATGKSPVICGKPFPAMVEGALARLDGSPDTTCIIGDRLYTDTAMGRATGILAVLVLSGETAANNIEAAPPEHRPDLVFENLAGVLAALKAP